MAIVLDVMMGGMDGWSVLQVLRADPATADIPVVMATMVDDQSRGYALGAADYLTKPVGREQLRRVLEKYRPDRGAGPILLVEDDPAVRRLVRQMLEGEGWEVAEAQNGREGLEQVSKVCPTLILLDLMMPEMDGFEFVEEIQQREEWRSIPVVVATGKDLSQADRERLNGYVERVLQKGRYSTTDLLDQVSALARAQGPPGRDTSEEDTCPD